GGRPAGVGHQARADLSPDAEGVSRKPSLLGIQRSGPQAGVIRDGPEWRLQAREKLVRAERKTAAMEAVEFQLPGAVDRHREQFGNLVIQRFPGEAVVLGRGAFVLSRRRGRLMVLGYKIPLAIGSLDDTSFLDHGNRCG